MPLANGCIPPCLPLINEDLHEEDDGSHDGVVQLFKLCLHASFPLWMKTCIRKTKDPTKARNSWSRFASSWLLYPPLPLWMKTCKRKTMDPIIPMTERNSWSRLPPPADRYTPHPLMNEDLHKEDEISHVGEEQLIKVGLQLTSLPLPPYEWRPA